MIAETEPIERLAEVISLHWDTPTHLKAGLQSEIYGPYLQAMMNHAVQRVNDGTNNPEATELALLIAADEYFWAERDYLIQGNTITAQELRKHQENVLNGTIELVPAEVAVSEANSIKQVESADQHFWHGLTDAQAVLSALNYGAFFRPQTMAGASRTLDRSEISELLAKLDSTQEAMPHLTLSNWAIGQTLAGIYQHVAESDKELQFRHIDIGSGHGATLAASISCINNLEISRKPEATITALETTPEFYTELVDFVKHDSTLTSMGLSRILKVDEHSSISEFGAVTALKTDAISALQNLNPKNFRDGEITVITANYSFHRFGSSQKLKLLELFAQTDNSIILVGDLAQNTSIINRRYFNLGANGPLNCGNRRLKNLFSKSGYCMVNLEQEKPASLDPRIANRMIQDHYKNDGHLWVAYRGKHAQRALNLIRTV